MKEHNADRVAWITALVLWVLWFLGWLAFAYLWDVWNPENDFIKLIVGAGLFLSWMGPVPYHVARLHDAWIISITEFEDDEIEP